MVSTCCDYILLDRTPPPIDITVCHEVEYSDEQFLADIRKARKALDRMERRALREERAGKTRRFP